MLSGEPTRLETDRILLRPFQETDLDDLYAYASVPGVGEMAGWPHHTSIDQSQLILRLFMKEKNLFALVLKEDSEDSAKDEGSQAGKSSPSGRGKVVGSLGLHQPWTKEDHFYDHLHALELGYVLAKAHWGKGIIPEASKLLIQYAFDELDLDAITCSHFKGNDQSRRVIEKLGFRFVKLGTAYAKQLKEHRDDYRYILMREDWLG